VALKVISERYLGDESARLRFLREARAAARLRHSNVASVLHLGRTGSSYFYAMEFVAGETLERQIQDSGQLEVKLALEIATQVTAGLTAVHKQNLVHRDIKPSNIMVSLEDEGAVTAKIIDLGLAKPGNELGGQTGISTPGAFVGTPEFASPEQFAGVGVDIRSDLYSLGVTLWEMLTGRLPFRGTPAEVMYQHQHAPLPLEQVKGFSPSVVALLEVLLAKDPAHRFQSPGELLKALELGTTRRKAAKIPGWLATLLPTFEIRVLVWSAIVLLVAGGLIVGTEIFLGYRHPISRATAAPEKRIAVLPFESLSEDKNDSYFVEFRMRSFLN
jgi:serine/threonine protein kinase